MDSEAASPEAGRLGHQLRIEPAGLTCFVSAGQTLLDAALAAGIDMPRSCRNGTCRTCLCTMTEGKVGYRIEWPGLSPDEKGEGCVLPCVALPQSDVVLLSPATRAKRGTDAPSTST